MSNGTIAVVIILVIVGLVWANTSGYLELPEISLNVTEKIGSFVSVKEVLDIQNCPDGIIPKKIELTENLNDFTTYLFNGRLQFVESTHYSGEEYYNSQTNWVDGQKIELFNIDEFEHRCHRGNLEGENINLIYCNNVPYSKSTTPVSGEGVIGKTNAISLSIDLILEKESTEILKVPKMYGTRDVPITTYNVVFFDCN